MAQAPQHVSDRQFIRRVIIVLALVALVYLLWEIRSVLLMLFGAVVVATIFRALADRIQKLTRMPDFVAVGLSVVLILGTIGLLAVMFGAQLGDQISVLGKTLPAAWESLQARISDIGLGDELKQVSQSFGQGGGGLSSAGRALMSIGSGVADTLIVIFGGIFLAAQPSFYRRGAIKLVPSAKRELVNTAMDDSERALRLWLKGQLIAMIMVGLLTGIGLWFLGLSSALALGLLAGLLEFIPFAGPIIAALPAVLIGLAAGPDTAMWVVILYLAVQQFEGAILQPIVQQYAVDLPGVVLLFSLLAFSMLFGTLGLILAAPLAVVSYVLVKRLYVQEALGTATPIPGEDKK